MRLIDADALPSVKFHALPYTHITPSDVNAESYKRGWNDAIDAIVDCAPTIDSVHVVRCADCKYLNEDIAVGKWDGSCRYWNTHSVLYSWFCSQGERKDGADK